MMSGDPGEEDLGDVNDGVDLDVGKKDGEEDDVDVDVDVDVLDGGLELDDEKETDDVVKGGIEGEGEVDLGFGEEDEDGGKEGVDLELARMEEEEVAEAIGGEGGKVEDGDGVEDDAEATEEGKGDEEMLMDVDVGAGDGSMELERKEEEDLKVDEEALKIEEEVEKELEETDGTMEVDGGMNGGGAGDLGTGGNAPEGEGDEQEVEEGKVLGIVGGGKGEEDVADDSDDVVGGDEGNEQPDLKMGQVSELDLSLDNAEDAERLKLAANSGENGEEGEDGQATPRKTVAGEEGGVPMMKSEYVGERARANLPVGGDLSRDKPLLGDSDGAGATDSADRAGQSGGRNGRNAVDASTFQPTGDVDVDMTESAGAELSERDMAVKTAATNAASSTNEALDKKFPIDELQATQKADSTQPSTATSSRLREDPAASGVQAMASVTDPSSGENKGSKLPDPTRPPPADEAPSAVPTSVLPEMQQPALPMSLPADDGNLDMQTAPELIELERALENAAETLNQIAICVTNFTFDHQNTLFEKV